MEPDAGTTTTKKEKAVNVLVQMTFWGSKEMHGLSDQSKSIQAIASKVAC